MLQDQHEDAKVTIHSDTDGFDTQDWIGHEVKVFMCNC